MNKKKELIFNNGQPMFSPNLNNLEAEPLSPTAKMEIMAEIELLDTIKNWFQDGVTQKYYQELAMIHSTVYDQQVAASSLLLTFQTAITQMEVERKVFVNKKGENERTKDLLKRNQMFMHVHQFSSAMLEKNKQTLLIAKNAMEKLAQFHQENIQLKKQLQEIIDAEKF